MCKWAVLLHNPRQIGLFKAVDDDQKVATLRGNKNKFVSAIYYNKLPIFAVLKLGYRLCLESIKV
tara:strand:+ start:103257 stop:103451 length:195 start_codon:yes stop_codon:yes gene_type:complete